MKTPRSFYAARQFPKNRHTLCGGPYDGAQLLLASPNTGVLVLPNWRGQYIRLEGDQSALTLYWIAL